MRTIILLLLLSYFQLTNAQNNWAQLSHDEQKLLLPFEPQWNNLDTETQFKLLNNANKWLEMTPLQRKESRQKLKNFKHLPKQERQKIKNRMKRFKNLDKEQRQVILQTHKRFKRLNPQQRKRIIKKFKNMPPEKRKRYMKKRMAKHKAMKFIKQFEPDERPQIKTMLKSTPKALRIKLRKHLRTIPSSQQKELIRDLLATNITNRIIQIEMLPQAN